MSSTMPQTNFGPINISCILQYVFHGNDLDDINLHEWILYELVKDVCLSTHEYSDIGFFIYGIVNKRSP